MTDKTEKPQRSAGSRILRERALGVLRDTRAKIDPQFLEAMRQKFSSLIPPQPKVEGGGNATTPSSFSMAMDLEREKRQTYPKTVFENDPPPQSAERQTEPVDKEKIAQIVLQYMKNKDGQSRH